MVKTSTKKLKGRANRGKTYINIVLEKYARKFSNREIKKWQKEDQL